MKNKTEKENKAGSRLKRSFSSFNMKYLPSILYCIIATILIFAPYQEESTLSEAWVHDVLYAVILILLVTTVIILVPIVKANGISKRSLLAMMPAVVMVIMNIVHRNGDASISGVVSLTWVVFCAFPAELKRKTFIYFRKVFIVVCTIGIVCYVLYLIKIPFFWSEVPYYWGGENMKYINFGVSFLYENNGVLRLCGICNEPGVLGTFAALILCADKVRRKSKGNLIMFVAGLLTFSLAFVFIMAIYILGMLLVRIYREKDKKRKALELSAVVVAILLWIFALPNINTGVKVIDYTFHRFTISSTGLSGDNRTTKKFDALFNEAFSQKLLFGHGKGYVSSLGLEQNLSYKVYILEYGVIGCLLMWAPLAIVSLYGRKKTLPLVLFVVVFFASIYQRPSIITPAYAVILLGGVEYICRNELKGGRKNVVKENS